MTTWLGKNVRVVVTRGPHQGRHGYAKRDLGRGEWLVHLDGRFGGTTVRALDMAPAERA